MRSYLNCLRTTADSPNVRRQLRAYEYVEANADELHGGEQDVFVISRQMLLQVSSPVLLVLSAAAGQRRNAQFIRRYTSATSTKGTGQCRVMS